MLGSRWEQSRENFGKRIRCKDWDKPVKSPLNPPSVSFGLKNMGKGLGSPILPYFWSKMGFPSLLYAE